jgi:hypothetical protein
MYISEELYAFLSRDAPHHHLVGALSMQYSVNQAIDSILVCEALDFGIII